VQATRRYEGIILNDQERALPKMLTDDWHQPRSALKFNAPHKAKIELS
jgi:hypothetical protein